MTDTQYYTLITIPLVGILMNGALFIYLGGRIDKVIDKINEMDVRVSLIESHLGLRKP